jgi:1-acyl-sn-glycerol-3-phosphate acyltransferase
MKKKFVAEIKFIFVNYVLVPILGIATCLLEFFGRIRFQHFERFPLWNGNLIIVSNHPSLFEPFILPLMGFPWMNFPWLFSPLWSKVKFSFNWFRELQKEFYLSKKLIPANVPDRDNFYDAPYWGLFRAINVPINRNGDARGRISTISALRKALENGGRVLLFPEGTRTYKAMRKSGTTTASGKKLGELKDGAAWLAMKTNASVLPIWVEGTDKVLPNDRLPFPRLWHRTTIKIGTPFFVTRGKRREATVEIAQHLLDLAEEEDTE